MENILLTIDRFQDARDYLFKHGRALEQALFHFHFTGGSKQQVLAKLQEFQDENGGFKGMGEGGEDAANAMDTNMAFQCLCDVGATCQDKVVQRGIRYIISSYDEVNKCWHPTPKRTKGGWQDNPSAELVGYLYEYRELVPTDFLRKVTDQAETFIFQNQKLLETDSFYFLSALCLLRLATRVDEPFKSRILDRLTKEVPLIIEIDAKKWTTTYCAKPFFFAESPDSPLYITIQEDVVKSLEQELLTQT